MTESVEDPKWPVVLRNLFTPRADLESSLKDLPWHPFREGVWISPLYGNQLSGPSAALLRYAPGAGIPTHEHDGYEHIIVLSEGQQDQSGYYPAGSLIIHPPGSQHAIANKRGGVVLVIRERPARFPK